MRILSAIHRTFKTDHAFRAALRALPISELGQPIQTAKYEPNAISLLQWLPWMRNIELIHSTLERKKQKFSVRRLTGVCAGKTPGNVDVETFLDYGLALRPAHEYTLGNRIGYETEEDFQTNCEYLRNKLSWIAGNDDGVPVVYHRKWDNTYYLVNIDGGNHFAAVYRQCVEQSRDFTFECRIEQLSLNVENCRKGLDGHGLLIVPTPCAEPLAYLLAEFGLKIRPYTTEFQTGKSLLSIGWNFFPKGLQLYRSVCETLPRKSYFDLSSYLLKLL